MKRKVIIGAVVVLSVAVLLWANLRNLNGDATPATAGGAKGIQGPAGAQIVRAQEVKKRDLTQEVVAPGGLEANGVREVRAPFTAKQLELKVGIGDQVKRGQVLASLQADELRSQVTAQEAQVIRAEANLASLRLQQSQAPIQLAQRLETARAQLLQAQEGLHSASRQSDSLKSRLEQAEASLTMLQNRSAAGSTQVESARSGLVKAEAAYRADPMKPGLRESYEQASAAYESALKQSQEAARQAAADLRRAYDELDAAQKEYARSSSESPVNIQLAQSQVESARLALQMAEMEAESGGTIASQVAAATADLSVARANLANLNDKLAQAELTAPADGTILAVAHKGGQPVQEGQLLFTMGDLNALKVTARVDEIDIGKVKPGQPLAVKSNAHPQERFHGEVVRVAAQTSQGQGGAGSSFEVEGRVQNSDNLLRAGMNAEVTISTAKRADTFVVGLAAIREKGQESFVLVVEDFKVKLRPVKLGLRTQTEVEVLEGLAEGDVIVISPFTLINSLADGDPVRVERVEEERP